MSASKKSKNLNMNLFLETDYVDFEDINNNFEIIDSKPFCVKSGFTIAKYQQYILSNGNENTQYGSETDVKWYYKVYNDKTFEMYAKIELTNLQCITAIGSLYRSGYVRVAIPSKYSDNTTFNIASIRDIKLSLSSDSYDWPVLTTRSSINDYFTFRLVGPKAEKTSIYRQIFLNVKGEIS